MPEENLPEKPVRSHEARLRVRYAETDQMGVVYYANYLIWMEVGRAEYFRAAGGRYRDMELDHGIRLAVVEAHCRYLHPARYDQEIAVKTWVANASRRSVEFHYEISDADSGKPLASGATKHFFLGTDMKPVKLPEQYWPLFGIAT